MESIQEEVETDSLVIHTLVLSDTDFQIGVFYMFKKIR